MNMVEKNILVSEKKQSTKVIQLFEQLMDELEKSDCKIDLAKEFIQKLNELISEEE